MKKIILIAASLLVLLGLIVVGAWFWWNYSLSPVTIVSDKTAPPEPVAFVITKNHTVPQIIDGLSKSRLIRSPLAVKIYLRLNKLDTRLAPGDYVLSASYSAQQIFAELQKGPRDVWVTLPEGWRREQIAARLHETVSSIDPAEFVVQTAGLEGQLFPDTYLIPAQATAADAVRILTSNFATKTELDLNRVYEIKLDGKTTTLSGREVLVMATLVEREGKTDSDRPVIAGILLRRLLADWPLQVDASLQYAIGTQHCQVTSGDCQWWRPPTDTKISSVYNTYSNKGLPPSPICNPGLAAINAVLRPSTSPYWYYLAGQDGTTRYAKTLQEHNNNIDKYL